MACKGDRGRQRHANTVLVEDLNEEGHFRVVDVRIVVNLILKK
jgi:hypothetical protein